MKTFTIVLTILLAFAHESYAKPTSAQSSMSQKRSDGTYKAIIQNLRG